MKTWKNRLIVAGLAAFWAGAAWSQGLAVSEPVAAVDNLPPAPVTGLQALEMDVDRPGIALTWTLSVDDAATFASFGESIVPRGGVRGYRIYRRVDNSVPGLLATVGAGIAQYTDRQVETGRAYIYEIRPFDLDNETRLALTPGSADDLARIVVVGGSPDVILVPMVKGRMTFDLRLDLTDAPAVEGFKARFAALVARLLGIEPARVKVLSIGAGSVVVEFEIARTDLAGQKAPAEALAELLTLADQKPQVFAELGPVLGLVDESGTQIVRLIRPRDASGNEVLGWFTREGDKVDFDDFFLFADHFGYREGEAGYDVLFDIVPNLEIDFDDFFRFADDFGKVVVNAEEVRVQLGL